MDSFSAENRALFEALHQKVSEPLLCTIGATSMHMLSFPAWIDFQF